METQIHLPEHAREIPKAGLFHWANLLYLVITILSILFVIRPAEDPAGKLPAWLDPGAAMMIAQVCLILIPALLFVWLTGQPIRTAFKLHALELRSAAKCLLIGLLCWPLFQGLTTLMQLVRGLLGISGSAAINTTGFISGSPWVMLIGLALVAPLCEEILFRGVLLGAYEKRWGVRSVWLIGLLFAVFHFDPDRIPGALLVGIIAGWLVYRTRSIWSGVLAHFGSNIIASLLILLLASAAPGASEVQATASQAGDLVAQMWMGALIWSGIGLVLMVPVFFLLRSIAKRNPAPQQAEGHTRPGGLWSYAALILGAAIYFATQFSALMQE